MKLSWRRICAVLLFGQAAWGTAAGAADAALTRVAGNWLTAPRDGIVQITADEFGHLQGRIVGGSHPGLLDLKNPDPTLRSLPLRGQVIIKGMIYDGNGQWSGGTIYKSDSGTTYKCIIELAGKDRLEVRGFLGFALLGVTQVWTRYTGTSMDLAPPVKSGG